MTPIQQGIRRHLKQAGLSMVEMFILVSLVGVLCSFGMVTFSGVVQDSKETKLRSDVKALNSAILAYLASNGDLSSVETPGDVIAKLKSASTDARYNGMRGGFLDSRVSLVTQSATESSQGRLRAYWDSSSSRFVTATSGPPGIKAFSIDEAGNGSGGTTAADDRRALMTLAQEDNWIWDYTEAPPTYAAGPTVIPVSVVAPPPAVAAAAAPPPPPPPPATALAPPVFSMPSGTYPFSDFDLSVSLIDPNPPGTAEIHYRVDFGPWVPYSAGLSVPAGSRINAQALPIDPAVHNASSVVSAYYHAGPVTLEPPLISPSSSSFGFFTATNIDVTLVDTNPPVTALLQYRLDGGLWLDYTGPFQLLESTYPSGVQVEARAISAGSPYYLPSSTNLEFLGREALNLTGNTVGEFHDPAGQAEMITNLSPGSSSSYFAWGDGSSRGNLSQSWMQFDSGTFTDIIDGVSFLAGSLTYYNGTILGGTGAETVDLDIVLDLDLNGTTFRPFFDFTFDLVNTPNSNDEIASADFVYLNDARASRTIVYNDFEFEFKLEFGETTVNGFSETDKFHVIENEYASANLYGTFNLLGPASNGSTTGGSVIIEDPTTGTSSDLIYQKEGYIDPEEAARSYLNFAEDARDDAKSGRDTADKEEDITQKSKVDILNKLDDGRYYEAYLLLQVAIEAAPAAEQAARAAEARANEAEAYSVKANEAAQLDANAADEALKVADAAADARRYADEARFFANDAASDLASVESAWENEIGSAPSGNTNAYLSYLATRAADEEDIASDAEALATNLADEALQAESDTAKDISDGKYKEAELSYVLAAPAALEAENQALVAEQAALTARALANEAVALSASDPDTAKAVRSADNAEGFALVARTAADAARIAALNTQAMWDNVIANAINNDAENWANYLLYLADLERRAAQSASDDAKSGRDDAVNASADTIKKVGEGKIIEAQSFAASAATAAAFADSSAVLAEEAAVEARSYAIQAGIAASNDPAAQNAYDDALVEADDAEAYATIARNFSDEAARAAADAQAAMP